MHTKALVGMLVMVAAVAGFQRVSPHQPTKKEAAAIVKRFLRAESTGAEKSAWALLRDCDGMFPTADYVVPTLTAQIIRVTSLRDTVNVEVRYVRLGRANAVNYTGSIQWLFSPDVRADTVSYIVIKDSSGKVWIGCNYYPPIHRSVAQMAERAVPRMADSTQVKWRAALAAARRLR